MQTAYEGTDTSRLVVVTRTGAAADLKWVARLELPVATELECVDDERGWTFMTFRRDRSSVTIAADLHTGERLVQPAGRDPNTERLREYALETTARRLQHRPSAAPDPERGDEIRILAAITGTEVLPPVPLQP